MSMGSSRRSTRAEARRRLSVDVPIENDVGSRRRQRRRRR